MTVAMVICMMAMTTAEFVAPASALLKGLSVVTGMGSMLMERTAVLAQRARLV